MSEVYGFLGRSLSLRSGLVLLVLLMAGLSLQAQTKYVISTPNSVSATQYFCQNSIPSSGLSATFNITPCTSGTGSGPATVNVQWYVNTTGSNTGGTAVGALTSGISVGTSTTVTFSLPPVNIATNTLGVLYYYCVVSNSSLSCGGTTGNATSTTVAVNTINQPVTSTWSVNPTNVCAGQSYTFTANAMGGATSYSWSTNNATAVSVTPSSSVSTTVAFASNLATSSTYIVTITGSGCGGTRSLSQTVRVRTPTITNPSTTARSTCQNVAFATPTTLTVTPVTISTTATYQWYSNSTASIIGGTSLGTANGAATATYTPQSTTAGTLYYFCIVTAAEGCTTTSAISGGWTVNPATSISAQSTAAQTVCQNASATPLSVSAVGVGLTYQWYSNTSATTTGGSAVGTNSASFTPSTTATGTTYYYCTVSGTCGAAATSLVSGAFKVDPTVAITSNISTSAQTACAGTSFSALSFTATGNTLSYKWYSDTDQSGLNGTEISGVTGTSYTPPTTGADLYYYAVATGSCGNAPTAYSGLFTVKPAPTLATAAQDSIVASGAVKINLSGLLPTTTHSVIYGISGTTASSPATSIISDASGKASFLANSTSGLTPANNNAILTIPTLTITGSGLPNCSNVSAFSANVRLMVSNTTRTRRTNSWTSATPTWSNAVPSINTGVCDTDANAAAGTCYGVGQEVPVYIGHNVEINQNVVVDNGVYYFGARGRGQPSNNTITDAPGGAAHSLTISRSGGFVPTQCIVDIQSGVTTFEGALTVNDGSLYVRSGATLIVGSCANAADPGVTCTAMSIGNNSSVYVEAGGTLIVKGDVSNTNNGTGTVTVIGYMTIEGDYSATAGNVNIVGSGEFVSTGGMSTQGNSQIFGSQNDCLYGPCSGTALACGSGSSYTFSLSVNGVIATSVPVCEGSPANFIFSTTAPTPAYQWQVSDVGPSTGFTSITGATTTTYSTVPVTTRYYRMMYTPTGCGTLYSNPVTVTVADVPSISTQPVSPGTICQFSTNPILSVNVSIAAGNSIQSYNWYPTANPATPVATTNTSSTTNSYSPSTSTAGSFSFYVDVLTTAGCKVSSNPAAFTVSAAPSSATISGNATICSGAATNLSVSFAGTAVAPYNFRYRNGSTGQETDVTSTTSVASVPVSPTAAATYTLVSASAGANCPVPAVNGLLGSAIISVNPVPTSAVLNSSYSGNITEVCYGTSVSFNAAISGGTSPYSVMLTDGTTLSGYNSGTSVLRTPTSNTNYAIVSLTDANGCAGTNIGGGGIAVTVNTQTVWNSSVTSGTWNTSANWTCGVPNYNLDATIPAGVSLLVDLPILPATTNATRGLTVNGTLAFDAGSALYIYGNMDVQGSFDSKTNLNKVYFSGAGQTITSRAPGLSGIAPIQFHDLEIANTAGTVSNDAARIDVFGVLKMASPTSNLDADGGSNLGVLRLRSTNESTAASIDVIPTGAIISGLITLQRHIGNPIFPSSSSSGYRYVATPVTGFTVGTELYEWIQNKGLFAYDETKSGAIGNGWVQLNTSSPIGAASRGRGYFSYVPPGLTVARGTVTTGQLNLPVTYTISTPTADLSADGWNVVGNPYPAPIMWNNTDWVWSKIDPVVYVPDIKNNVWNTYDPIANQGTNGFTGVIAMGQGFWIHANGLSPSLSIKESAKRPYDPSKYTRESYSALPTLEINLIDGTKVDQSILVLDGGATNGYDRGRDALKIDLQEWGVSTLSEDLRLVHNWVSTLDGPPVVLDIKVTSGIYKLQFNDRNGTGQFDGMYLIDHYLGTSTRVKLGESISFEVNADPASRIGRFALTAGAAIAAGEELFSAWPNPSSGGAVQLRAVSQENVDFQVMSVDGKHLYSGVLKTVDGSASGVIDFSSFGRGMYLIKANVKGKNLIIKHIVR